MKTISSILLILMLILTGSRISYSQFITVGSSFSPNILNIQVPADVTFEAQFNTCLTHRMVSTTIPQGASSFSGTIYSCVNSGVYVSFTVNITVPGVYEYTCDWQGHSHNTGQIIASSTSINQISSSIPDKYSLYQNYPNPFNPSSNIKFDIVKSGFVSLKVYNSLGQEVSQLANENLSPGTYEAIFDGSGLNSGIYFYTIRAGEFVETKKMILTK